MDTKENQLLDPPNISAILKDQQIAVTLFKIQKKQGMSLTDAQDYLARALYFPTFKELYKSDKVDWKQASKDFDLEIESINNYYFSKKGIDRGDLWTSPQEFRESTTKASWSTQYLFRAHNIHDFNEQKAGIEHKIIKTAFLVGTKLEETLIALYRDPISGTPKIGIADLQKFSGSGNELAVAVYRQQIFFFNFSRYNYSLLLEPKGALADILQLAYFAQSPVCLSDEAKELLNLLKPCATIPFINPNQSGKSHSKDVGIAVETYLGIKSNSSTNPDYKGIELKAGRNRGHGGTNRKTLFCKVPKWKLGSIKSSREFASLVGYMTRDTNKLKQMGANGIYGKELKTTSSCKSTNNQFLRLKVDETKDMVIEAWYPTLPLAPNTKKGDLLFWEGKTLREVLQKKHPETFWIYVNPVNVKGSEHFLITKILYTHSPVTARFLSLIEQGIVTLDHEADYSKTQNNATTPAATAPTVVTQVTSQNSSTKPKRKSKKLPNPLIDKYGWMENPV